MKGCFITKTDQRIKNTCIALAKWRSLNVASSGEGNGLCLIDWEANAGGRRAIEDGAQARHLVGDHITQPGATVCRRSRSVTGHIAQARHEAC